MLKLYFTGEYYKNAVEFRGRITARIKLIHMPLLYNGKTEK